MSILFQVKTLTFASIHIRTNHCKILAAIDKQCTRFLRSFAVSFISSYNPQYKRFIISIAFSFIFSYDPITFTNSIDFDSLSLFSSRSYHYMIQVTLQPKMIPSPFLLIRLPRLTLSPMQPILSMLLHLPIPSLTDL